MPSASASPRPPPAILTSGGGMGGTDARPPLMKRQSSASSHSSRQAVMSPGSAGEHQPLRHPVKTRHTKIVLPRNHNSARNLAKVARQAQNANAQTVEDGHRHSRQRSHEGDTEIRLPGSLDESNKPPIRRNMTAYQLPRNLSNVKLKKNLSHGQLSRLGSGRNLAALNSTVQRAPPSPGLKGRSKRPKSADLTGTHKELLDQQIEHAEQTQRQARHARKSSDRKVGFAVGSVGDASDEEDVPEMEGSGLHEDEWTEESASASPFSTRQNTANNSRRPSVVIDRVNDKLPPLAGRPRDANAASRRWEAQSAQDQDGSSAEESSEPPSPRSMGHHQQGQHNQKTVYETSNPEKLPPQDLPLEQGDQVGQESAQEVDKDPIKESARPLASQRSVSAQSKELKNPTTRRLLDKSQHLPAPALVSNVSAMDDMHSLRGSPAPSLRSSRSNIGDGAGDVQEDELVSRFVPSTSHPSMGSGPNTALSTPKQSEFHTPEEDGTLGAQRRGKSISGFQLGPVSPGSTVSGSSGATTPAVGRSRTELRMLQEKAMADLETAADHRPHLPAHVYDRRNESLKSYLNMAGLGDGRGGPAGLAVGPDLFQGRFRALNTELRVVQKFRDPLGEAVARLKACKGSRLHQRTSSAQRAQQVSGLATSKSAVSLPGQRAQKGSDLSKSASPPKGAHGLRKGTAGAQSAVQIQHGSERQKGRREVSFARTPPETREIVRGHEELGPDVIARHLWDAI